MKEKQRIVFLFLYAFLPALWGEFSWAEAWANVKQAGINFVPRESHLWFVYMMLGLYLVMPVISPWLSKAGKKEEQFYHRSFTVSTPQELEMHWQNDTIVAGIMSACIFLLFRLIQEPGKGYCLVRSISGASYGMYLMHMLMLPAVFSLLDPLLPAPLAIICTALLAYTLSFALTSLIGKLPFGKFIVG